MWRTWFGIRFKWCSLFLCFSPDKSKSPKKFVQMGGADDPDHPIWTSALGSGHRRPPTRALSAAGVLRSLPGPASRNAGAPPLPVMSDGQTLSKPIAEGKEAHGRAVWVTVGCGWNGPGTISRRPTLGSPLPTTKSVGCAAAVPGPTNLVEVGILSTRSLCSAASPHGRRYCKSPRAPLS